MDKISDLTLELKTVLVNHGADLVGIGDLTQVPEDQRYGLPIGISVAVKYPKEIIQGISELPTLEYKQWYDSLNEKLDQIVTTGAEFLKEHGYQAVAKNRAQVGGYGADCTTELPHKTVATRAGLGWIGKCALLVTEQYGSMVRLSSILTDAPLETAEPVNQSKCGSCTACRDACPALAIYGTAWEPGLERHVLFDYQRCKETAQIRCLKGFGQRVDLCGKCIEVCPYTKRYINSK